MSSVNLSLNYNSDVVQSDQIVSESPQPDAQQGKVTLRNQFVKKENSSKSAVNSEAWTKIKRCIKKVSQKLEVSSNSMFEGNPKNNWPKKTQQKPCLPVPL